MYETIPIKSFQIIYTLFSVKLSMKNFMLLPAAKSNPIDGNDNDDEEIEIPKETSSDCEQGIFFQSLNLYFSF